MEGKISKFSRTCLPCQDCSLLPATILHVNISDAAGGCQGAYINPTEVSRDEIYIVRSANNLIDQLEFPGSFSFANLLWKSLVPPKIERFLWLVL